MWVETVLTELNDQAHPDPSLPSASLITILQELLDPSHFMAMNRPAAIAEVNDALKRDALTTYLDETDQAQVRSITGASSATITPKEKNYS